MYVQYMKKTSTSFSCIECHYSTSRQDNLNKHIKKRHNNTPATSNLPPKVAHHNPIFNIIDPPTNDLFYQDIEQQELTDMLSTQVGFGDTQISPADENIPEEVKSVQSALSDLLNTSAMHGTFSCTSIKRGLILIGLELNTNARESFEHC